MSAPYIKVVFPAGISSAFQPAFDEAVDFWNAVIVSGASPNTLTQGLDASTTQCGVTYTYPPGAVINGLEIFASTPPIDGPGQILGRAGPCVYHGSIFDRPLFPMLGIMEFDSADSSDLVDQGQFANVVVHEMGHVVGIGTLWPALEGILEGPCPIFGGSRPCDPYYIGANGIDGFNKLNPPSSIGARPPVENQGGSGTANGHWREVTFDNELMTGYLNAEGENPLSIMTILSLKDLGYVVDESVAESYSVPAQARGIADNSIELFGDMLVFEPQYADELQGLVAESNYEAQFSGLFFVMISGFMLLAGMFGYLNHRQNKRFELLLNQGNVATPSPMFQKETA